MVLMQLRDESDKWRGDKGDPSLWELAQVH